MKIALKEAMSKHPMTVRYKDDLHAAYLRLKREGFRHLPVIDDAGELVGVISDRDFQRAMWPGNTVDAHGLPDGPNFRKDAKVGEYMSWPAVCLPEDTGLDVAIRTMLDRKISAIVVTKEDRMTGILTQDDLLRILSDLLSEPQSIASEVNLLAFNSSLGKVAEALSTAGI